MLRFILGTIFLMVLAQRLGLPQVAGVLGAPLLLLPWRRIAGRWWRRARAAARITAAAVRRGGPALAARAGWLAVAAHLGGAAACRRLADRLDPPAVVPEPVTPIPVLADGLSAAEGEELAAAAVAYARLLGRELPDTVGIVVERRETACLDRLGEHVAIRLPLPADGEVAGLLPALRDLVSRALAAGEAGAAPAEPETGFVPAAAPAEPEAAPAVLEEAGSGRDEADPLPPDPIQSIMASLPQDA